MNNFRFKLSLRIQINDSSIDPDEIVKQLRWIPDRVYRIGEVRVDKKGRLLGGSHAYSYCGFSLTPLQGEELHEMFERISDELSNHQDLLKQIKATGGKVEFFIGWFTQDMSGDTFDSVLLSKLGVLGIDLSICVYIDDQPVQPHSSGSS
jgi:hypothetical protein